MQRDGEGDGDVEGDEEERSRRRRESGVALARRADGQTRRGSDRK